jgi:hypothetical protein
MLTASRATPTATRRQQQGPEEGIDHLFLLPERVLGMDSTQLRQDLAGLDFSVQLLQAAPQGNVWLCKCSFQLGQLGDGLLVMKRPDCVEQIHIDQVLVKGKYFVLEMARYVYIVYSKDNGHIQCIGPDFEQKLPISKE